MKLHKNFIKKKKSEKFISCLRKEKEKEKPLHFLLILIDLIHQSISTIITV